MKNKERRALAQKMAKAEWIIQTSDDKKAIAKAENEIIELSSHIDGIEDIDAIDEMIQEILASKKKT